MWARLRGLCQVLSSSSPSSRHGLSISATASRGGASSGPECSRRRVADRYMCSNYIDGIDFQGDADNLFFSESMGLLPPTLTFAVVKPDTPAEGLRALGWEVVTRSDGTPMIDQPEPTFGALPYDPARLHHLPARGGRDRRDHMCPSSSPKLPMQSSLALLRTRGGYATFEGFTFMKDGPLTTVFSSSHPITGTLLEQLATTLPRYYRASRRCPPSDGLHIPCCLEARQQSLAKLSLLPFVGLGKEPVGKGTRSFFYDELQILGPKLRACHAKRKRKGEAAAPAVQQVELRLCPRRHMGRDVLGGGEPVGRGWSQTASTDTWGDRHGRDVGTACLELVLRSDVTR